HCLADGVAGVGIMNVLMDTKPVTVPRRVNAKVQPTNDDKRDAGAKLLQQLVTSYLGAIQGMLQVQKEVLSAAEILVQAGRSTLEQMLSVAPEIVMPAERLPFNKLCRGPQKFAWTTVPMKPLLAIKELCDSTLNDVMLGIMTLATRKYAELHNVRLKKRLLRIIIPVNIRGTADQGELGNRISFAPVNLPMDIPDPRRLLEQVKLRTQYIKQTHLAEYVGMAGMLITSLPIPLQALALPYAGMLPISLSNYICTNVPGPQVPLYFMGHKMMTWHPHVPIGGEMGVNTAMLTYNGSVYFGFTIDMYAAPDAELFEKLVPEAFAEFCKAFKLRTTTASSGNRAAKKRAPKAPGGEERRTGADGSCGNRLKHAARSKRIRYAFSDPPQWRSQRIQPRKFHFDRFPDYCAKCRPASLRPRNRLIYRSATINRSHWCEVSEVSSFVPAS
ncbi:MAG: WS/DGAT domain-containing protein, partial [Terriglobales bacterium]